MSLLWINGNLVDKSDARISVFDHGFLYGDGVWEPLRVFNGKLFRPEAHLLSLLASAYLQGIEIPLTQAELMAAAEQTARANNRAEGYVRIIVSRGPGPLGPDPRKVDPQVIIVAEEYQPFPRELAETGLHVLTDDVRYGEGDLSIPDAGTLSQAYLVRAKSRALKNGCLDAVFLNQSMQVLGTTEGDLLIVKAGEVIDSPESQRDVLAGVVIDELVPGMAPHRTASFTLSDLLTADEVFLAGTSCGIIAISSIDKQPIGSGHEGPMTRQIRQAYRKLTRNGE
jgi:branched-chain amino acid aminotransferase